MTDGKIEVEFTDRYGGRKPPWNYCRGGCEAMSAVPVRLPGIVGEGGIVSVGIERDGRLLDLARREHALGIGHEDDGYCDGWHFVSCPDCGGTGEISKVRALRHLPGKAWRTLRFVWDCGVRSYSRPPWMSWREQMVMVLRIAVGLAPR